MDSISNQPQWDAKRLVQEYLKKADLIKHCVGKPFDDIAWSNQIRIMRIASVLRAFMGLKGVEEKPLDLITSVFDGWVFDRLFEGSPLQEGDYAQLMAKVKEAMKDDQRFDSIMQMANQHSKDPYRIAREKERDRRYMLHMLLEYRKDAEKIISHFDGLMEGTAGVYLCALAVKGSCIVPLKDGNEKIDDIIVMLLGDKFKQSFSEEELIANYDYPEETDAQLSEWDCDNY